MFSAEPVLFEIPVLPRIKKFIAVKLQDEAGRPQPMLASPDNLGIGMYIWSVAQSPKVRTITGWRNLNHPQPETLYTDKMGAIIGPETFTARLGLGISRFHKSRHQYLLNYTELQSFSSCVDYIIENELYCYCAGQSVLAPMERIKAFCDLYDFSEDDLKEDALKKMLQRAVKQQSGLNFDAGLLQMRHFVAYMPGMAMAA